ncbi:hypothetical protein [Nocardioides montaniterrae]
MAMQMRPRALKVDVPAFEPDAVMLDRLTALSADSTPSAGPARSVGLRVTFVAAVVASLGATTWAAGAIPGVATPFTLKVITHAPLLPTTPDRSTGTPQADGSSPGSPAPTGLPDTLPSAAAHAGGKQGTTTIVLPQGIVVAETATHGHSEHPPAAPAAPAAHTAHQHKGEHGKAHDASHGPAEHAKPSGKPHHKTAPRPGHQPADHGHRHLTGHSSYDGRPHGAHAPHHGR